MKRILFSMLFFALSMTAMAVPAKRGIWKTVKLSDGREIRVELRGDEYMSFWQSENGQCYVKADDKAYYVKADMEALRAKAMEMRRQNPLPQPLEQQRAEGGRQARVSIGGSHPDFVGEKKGLIILANFKDVKFQPEHDAEFYTHVANDLGFTSSDGYVGSIRDYFKTQSEGKFDLTFDIVGPIEMSHDMAYYGAHFNGANDKNPSAMVRECVQGAAKILENFDAYDWFNDGYVDQVFVIYAGRGEANGGGENSIWPHRSQLSTAITVGSKRVRVYACSNEMQGEDMVDGIGAFCHEFSHCLGLPDFYDISYTGDNYGMGFWDLMHGGCYLGNSFIPCSYSGYERNYCGWKELIELKDDVDIEGMKGINEGGDCYVVYNDAHPQEYYIMENRTQTGWDAGLYGSGLLIAHVDFNKDIWASNYVNTTDMPNFNNHQRYTPFLADNSTVLDGGSIAGDVYPYKSNNQLTDHSVPEAMLYNKNADGKYLMNKPITKITRHDDGTISFSFANNVGKELEGPMPEGCVFRETFNQSYGVGGNDELWAGSGVGSTVFVADNEGWVAANKFGGDRCAVFGTNRQAGIATTPEIELNGDMVLKFRAGAYTGEAAKLTLSIISGEATLDQNEIQLTAKQWNDCNVGISGNGKTTIRFRSNKGRFFLDEIYVMESTGDGISNVTAESTTGAEAYNLAGQRVDDGFKGVVINGGKKVLKK